MKTLSENHRSELETGSAIKADIVAEMGAWTATTKAELAALGFRQAEIKPPALVLPVLTWAGERQPAYSRIKPDQPRMNPQGKARKYEQPHGQACRVYCLPSARRFIEGLQGLPDRPRPALPFVFITEGEKKAASLVSQGLAALALPGVWNFKGLDALRGDWDVIGLKGLQVCVVFDSDAATNPQVRQAEERLAEMLGAMDAKVFVCRLPAGPGGAKTGADDFFVRGAGTDDLESLIEPHAPEKARPKPSATDDLIELARQSGTFWHDPEREPFATTPLASGGRENLPVRDPRFREWLAGEAYKRTRQAAPREAMDRAIETLAAAAKFDGETKQTARRIGHSGRAVYLDLCDGAHHIVRVTSEGWGLVADSECEVRFLRPRHAGALPMPSAGQDLRALGELLSTDADGLRVVEAFLMGAFMPPPGGFPILVATGEQGSGKSFGSKVIRGLIDPATPALRNVPKEERDLAAALSSGYVLAFDNLTRVPTGLSDSLCALATGSGIAGRKLFTDAEEHVVTGRRPVLLNGINDVVSAPDLAERCLFVHFTRPADGVRATEAQLEAQFSAHAGELLGALLDRVVRALRDREQVNPGELPRLADFALWVYAGTPAPEREEAWRVLSENRRSKNLATIEEDSLASAVQALAARGDFAGTARELLAALNEQEGIDGPKTRPEGWPASPEALGRKLQRLAPVLRAIGIEARQERKGKARLWRVSAEEGGKQPSQPSQPSQVDPFEPEESTLDGDSSGDGFGEPSSEPSLQPEACLNLNTGPDDSCDGCDGSFPVSAGRGSRRVVL